MNVIFILSLLFFMGNCQKSSKSSSDTQSASVNLSQNSTSLKVAPPIVGTLIVGGLGLVGTSQKVETSTSTNSLCKSCKELISQLKNFTDRTKNEILTAKLRNTVASDETMGTAFCSHPSLLQALLSLLQEQLDIAASTPMTDGDGTSDVNLESKLNSKKMREAVHDLMDEIKNYLKNCT